MGKLYLFLLAHLGSPGQWAIKRVCVCVLLGDGLGPQAQLPRPLGRADRHVDEMPQQNAGDGRTQETQLHPRPGMSCYSVQRV